jgi:hypothetical protein
MQHECINETQPAKFFTHKSQGQGESDRKKTTFAQLKRTKKKTMQATILQEARVFDCTIIYTKQKQGLYIHQTPEL